MGPILRYNLSRFALFAAFLAVGYVVGLAGLVLLLAALVGSGVTSYFMLRDQRLAMIAAMAASADRRETRAAAKAGREDDWDEQQRRVEDTPGPDDLAG